MLIKVFGAEILSFARDKRLQFIGIILYETQLVKNRRNTININNY